jgi:hypothetical protein
MERQEVYKVIDGEREYQDTRWKVDVANGRELHSPVEFLAFIQDYVNQGFHEVCRNQDPLSQELVLITMRKITALGVACLEQHGAPERE